MLNSAANLIFLYTLAFWPFLTFLGLRSRNFSELRRGCIYLLRSLVSSQSFTDGDGAAGQVLMDRRTAVGQEQRRKQHPFLAIRGLTVSAISSLRWVEGCIDTALGLIRTELLVNGN